MFGITKRDTNPIIQIAQKLGPDTDFKQMSAWGILFLVCGSLARQAEKSVVQDLVPIKNSNTTAETNIIKFSQLIEEWANSEAGQLIAKQRINSLGETEVDSNGYEDYVSYLSLAITLNSFTESNEAAELSNGGMDWQLMFFAAGFLLSDKLKMKWEAWRNVIFSMSGDLKPEIRQLFEEYASPQYLRNAIRTLSRIQRDFQFLADSLLADIALFGLTFDVLDSARAVEIIAETEFPHRAYPIARTAFEAAQQAMVLATQENYVLAGTRAWIYFCEKDSEWLGKACPEGSGVNSKEDAEKWFRDRLAEVTVMWEEISPGKRELIGEAKRLIGKDRNAKNWLNQKMEEAQHPAYIRIGESLGQVVKGDSIEMNKSIYSRLSEETHARARLKPVSFRLGTDGLVDVKFASRDVGTNSQSASLVTAISALEAATSLAYRMRVQPRKINSTN